MCIERYTDNILDYYNEEDYIGFDDDEEEEEDDAAGDDGEKKATTVEDNDDEDDAEEWLESAEAEWARLNQG